MNKITQKGSTNGLMDKPEAHLIKVHLNNLILTFGENAVKEVIEELSLKQSPKKRATRSAVGQ